MKRLNYLALAVFAIASLLLPASAPTVYAADPVHTAWCPTSDGEATTVLSADKADKSSWKQLPLNGGKNIKWKMDSDALVDVFLPHTPDGMPVGTFDHHVKGDGYVGDISQTKSVTYNCPAGAGMTAAASPANSGNNVIPLPINPLPTSCPKDGWEASLLTDGLGTWTDMGAPKWRGYRIWKFKSADGKPVNIHHPGFGRFLTYKYEGAVTHSIWSESVDFHCR